MAFRLTPKRYEAIGRITGRFPESFHPEAIRAFFAYTDRGEQLPVPDEAVEDYCVLLDNHQWYESFNDMMIESFHEVGGFLLGDYLRKPLPFAYLLRVFYCCRKGFGFIPWLYYNGWKGDGDRPPEEFERFAPCYLLREGSGGRLHGSEREEHRKRMLKKQRRIIS